MTGHTPSLVKDGVLLFSFATFLTPKLIKELGSRRQRRKYNLLVLLDEHCASFALGRYPCELNGPPKTL